MRRCACELTEGLRAHLDTMEGRTSFRRPAMSVGNFTVSWHTTRNALHMSHASQSLCSSAARVCGSIGSS